MKEKTHDVLIVGSGAGGGPLALTLARAGLSVLVLEKGPNYSRQEYPRDEIASLNRNFFTPSLTRDPHTVVTAQTSEPQLTNLGWVASCVGGGTVHMGGYLYRFHPDDFRLQSRYGSYEEVVDWPYSYEELEPFYTQAEWAVGVSGQAGANPFEGTRSKTYPMPPLPTHPIAKSLENVCRSFGFSPFPTPRAVNSQPYGGRPACVYCNNCSGFGCRIGAKGSTQETLIHRAITTGNCEVRDRTMVRRITTNAAGQVDGCIYFDAQGKEQKAQARLVCICCSAVESARLLLLSKSSTFPHGLANNSGQVGRNLQFHSVSQGMAHFRHDKHPEKLLHNSHPFLGRSVMDSYFLPKEAVPLSKGGLLRFGLIQGTPIDSATLAAFRNGSSLWGMELKKAIREISDYRSVSYEIFHDFYPNSQTYVSLDTAIKDRWGLPVARIHLQPARAHKQVGKILTHQALSILNEMGADDLTMATVGGTSAYLVHGTCRMGTHQERSVLNPYCRTHEVKNLFVVDGSFMPTSGGAPPTLTILANSFRTAKHILERSHSGEFT